MSKKRKRVAEQKESQTKQGTSPLVRRHLRIGWWSLLVFLSLGITLEAMHGFKVQWYVGDQNSTRRLMWTLSHAHGTLLSLVHLAFAAVVGHLGTFRWGKLVSWCLFLGTLLLPIGFFAGGLVIYEGDPSLGILLVPLGAGVLFVAVMLTALAVETTPFDDGET